MASELMVVYMFSDTAAALFSSCDEWYGLVEAARRFQPTIHTHQARSLEGIL
jgi:hypothetical protein